MVNLGDQIVALKNSISLSHLDSSNSNVINDTSDQVLLKIVKRLASLQQQQQQQQQQQHTINNHLTDEENYDPEPNNNKSGSQIIKGLISDIPPNEPNTNDTYIEALDKDNHFEKLIQDVRNKYSTGRNNNRLKEGKHQLNNMGSNVSRHSGKGLSGRRTQSSGNLCNDTIEPVNGALNTSNNKRKAENGKTSVAINQTTSTYVEDHDTVDSGPTITANTSQFVALVPTRVSKTDRNKFCGSLPNHLDTDDVCEENVHHNYVDNNNAGNDGKVYVTVGHRNNPLQHHPNHLPPRESSPYNNSSSEKESTSSSTTTFRTNHETRSDIQLKLPINRSNLDIGCDQGYGSERSPEDELPPSLPLMSIPYQPEIHEPPWDYDKFNGCEYSFITKDCCFMVQVPKGPRGLGLSVSGGVDTNAAFPGLIRIKRLFPHQSAWCTGMLQPGDILLEANGTPLSGLTNYEALEVLRTAPNYVTLTVCRPRDEQYRKLSPPAEPPKPPQRSHPNSLPLEPLSPIQTYFSGEFEIIMVKQQGSLGFTLRKEDESVLGHYVRALVREPATTDGRIKPGDKIVAVNDVPLCPLTHEEAVIFLRQAADTVKLRLYRDNAQTPITSMSPTSTENKTICNNTVKQKACLRPEAMNLLIDLAYKNRKAHRDSDSTGSSIQSNTTSPRRLRRGNNKNCSTNTSNISQSETDKTDSKSFNYQPKYIVTSQPSSLCSDSETSTMSQCSFVVQPNHNSTPNWNNTYTVAGSEPDSEFYNEDELWKMMDGEHCDYPDGSGSRPSYLDLAGNSGSTPIVSRKPRFQFSVAANSYELNNLDNEALDAPVFNAIPGSLAHQYSEGNNQDFTSLPCETFLVACRTENDFLPGGDSFRHKNPMYQSAHVPSATAITEDNSSEVDKNGGTRNLLKWKGVMFGGDDEKDTPDSSCAATIGTNPTPGTEKDLDFNGLVMDEDGYKIIAVELNRGWNSRLGFSLQYNPDTKQTFISAIYNDSVAAKDGRLCVGDQILRVNDELLESVPTSHIIELLRIIRGSIVVTVRRKNETN